MYSVDSYKYFKWDESTQNECMISRKSSWSFEKEKWRKRGHNCNAKINYVMVLDLMKIIEDCVCTIYKRFRLIKSADKRFQINPSFLKKFPTK